jgi:hypothetical protein
MWGLPGCGEAPRWHGVGVLAPTMARCGGWVRLARAGVVVADGGHGVGESGGAEVIRSGNAVGASGRVCRFHQIVIASAATESNEVSGKIVVTI